MIKTLLYCHDNCIVHGDIKPDNFLIENKNPILIDFGLSFKNDIFSNNLNKNVVIYKGKQGTEGYMAPEVNDNYIGLCSDVYSLGITIYHLFTNESPYFEKNNLVLDFNETTNLIPYKIQNLLSDMLEHDYRNRPTLEDIVYEYDIFD